MSDERIKKLNSQLINTILDDRISSQTKINKLDYIIRAAKGDINACHDTGYSLLSLAKLMGDEKIVRFLEKNGARETEFDEKETTKFFRKANIEDINKFLKILPDGYELDCDVDLSKRGLTELPDFSRIVVNGNFNCSDNQLMTLNGAPSKVRGGFYCFCNYLKTLKGAPSEVGKNFDCNRNQLITLKGAPSKVAGYFDCDNNKLTTLKGAPSEVGMHFHCRYNKLKSFKGKPNKIGGNFYGAIEAVNNINDDFELQMVIRDVFCKY